MGNELIKGTFVIFLVSIAAKIISYLTEAVLASKVGSSSIGDAYYMVIGIQYVLYPMLSVGIWKVFLPIYKKRQILDQRKRLDMFSDSIITIFGIVSIMFILMMMGFDRFVIGLLAPGFADETKKMSTEILFVSSPMYFFIVMSAIYATMLQCHNKFYASQIREVISHVPTIIICLFFYKKYGYISLGYGLLLGGIFRLLIELFYVDWHYSFRPRIIFNKDLRMFFKAFPAAFIAEGVIQINVMVDKIMASTLATGAISVLNYGSRLTNVFSGLVSNSISTAFYPKMSELIAQKKHSELSSIVDSLICLYCLVIIPVSVGCITYRREIVSIAFQRGEFDINSVVLTSNTFLCYSVGLFFLASNTIFNNILYSYGETKKTMYISILNLIINIVLNVLLISKFKANGLAIATSLSAIFTFFIRIRFLRGLLLLNKKKILIRFVSVLAVSLAICYLTKLFMNIFSLNKYLLFSVEILISSIFYFLFLLFTRYSETTYLFNIIKAKLKRKL